MSVVDLVAGQLRRKLQNKTGYVASPVSLCVWVGGLGMRSADRCLSVCLSVSVTVCLCVSVCPQGPDGRRSHVSVGEEKIEI